MARKLGNFFFALLLTACATTDTDIFPSDPVVRPGARIQLGNVAVPPDKSYEIDAAGMLRSAMQTALSEHGIAWRDEPDSERFVLNLTIQDYEPGSAFQRWLLPGLGATILHVTGELIDLSTGEQAGKVDHERGIYAGGAYTIGGWEKIFQTVANDIATELDNRINNKGFVVSLKPWPARDLDIPEAKTRSVFTITDVTDSRAERGRIGERTAAFGVGMGDVFFDRSVPAFMAEAVAAELIGAGHQIANDSTGRPVSIDVKSFWTHTDTTALYWDVVGNIQIGITVGMNDGDKAPKHKTFDCEATTRTYAWPSLTLVSDVMDQCLTQLMGKLRGDAVWDPSGAETPLPSAPAETKPAQELDDAKPPVTALPYGEDRLPDGQYVLTLSEGIGNAYCTTKLPEGSQQAFRVENGTVKQERLPFIRIRSEDIEIYGNEFSATFVGPFLVQGKAAMRFKGRRIDNGFRGSYVATTGSDACDGKFQLLRVAE